MKFGIAVRKARLASGVALLKVDDDVRLWTRTTIGVGFQIDGLREIEGANGKGVIIRARQDGKYTCPRKLRERRVYYRLYRDKDRTGALRPYLYLRTSSDLVEYRGTRLIVISRDGVFVVPDKTNREICMRTDAARENEKREDRLYAGLSFDEVLELEEKI